MMPTWLKHNATNYTQPKNGGVKMLPKVTCDLKEYLRLTQRTGFAWEQIVTINELQMSKLTHALYFNGVIWMPKLSARLLLHEVVHHIIGNNAEVTYIAPRLFGDMLNTLWDVFYFRAWHYKTTIEQRRECVKRIKHAVNDFLDWMLCR